MGTGTAMDYFTEHVTFESHGETLAGTLFLPKHCRPFAAVVVIGPVAFVKEQSPLQYATRLAQRGAAVLIFDPRFHGASSGMPRRHESGRAKIEDIHEAITFLIEHAQIDNENIGVLGICQGVNWAIEASDHDPRIQALAVVAGHYLTPATALNYLDDQATIDARMARSVAAKQAYEETGEVRYIPVCGSRDALLTAPPPGEWYAPWANHAPWFAYRGQWENRITAMSEASIWGWDITGAMGQLTTPLTMVHADQAASGDDLPRTLFQQVPAPRKTCHWIEGANQLMFYEDPQTIDRAVAAVAAEFSDIFGCDHAPAEDG